MSSQWINIDKLGTVGVEPDLMPTHRQPQSLDEASNIRAVGPNLSNAGGYLQVTPNVPLAANSMFLAKDEDDRILILCSQDSIYQYTGTTWKDITGTAVDDGTDSRWSGGWLTGAITLANNKVVRTYKPGVDAATQPMVYNGGPDGAGDETWESKNYSAKVFRPFREYMLAGNVTWGNARYPSRVQWCDAVEPGQVPVDWVPRDTNDAGDVDLADTPGSVVDMHPLRDKLMVYKRDAIHSCEWIGGNSVFAFKRLTTIRGLSAKECIVEYDSLHYVQGADDIFQTDGNKVHSLLWGRNKRAWLADRCNLSCERAFTAIDIENEEILFFYRRRSAPSSIMWPNRALVFSLRNNAFTGWRDYDLEVPHAGQALDVDDQNNSDLVFYGIDRGNSRLLDFEAAPDRLDNPVPSYFYRTGLFGDPGHDWVQIDEAKLNLTGARATLQVGDQVALDGVIRWQNPLPVNPMEDYKTPTRTNGNLIAYRVDISTKQAWQVSSLMLRVQKSGERG